MSARVEFERRLGETRLKIKQAQMELDQLTKRREDAVVVGGRDAGDLKRQVKAAQEQLEDLTITKLALEAKIRTYQQNEPAAAELRAKITSTWSQVQELIGQLGTLQDQFREQAEKLIPEIGRLENEVQLMDKQYFLLAGEPAHVPTYLWPRELRDFLAPAARIYPAPPWTFTSVAEREAAAAKLQAKQRGAQEARVKTAIEQALPCVVCKKPMTLRRYAGYDGETRPGSGTWQYEHCNKMATKHIPETVLESK